MYEAIYNSQINLTEHYPSHLFKNLIRVFPRLNNLLQKNNSSQIQTPVLIDKFVFYQMILEKIKNYFELSESFVISESIDIIIKDIKNKKKIGVSKTALPLINKYKIINNNNNNKIVNDIKVIGGDIILDSAKNMRPKENNGYYDDINCNFNVNNYLNENSLRDKKENTGKSQKQKEKIKLDKLKEKIISGKLINKKPNDKFIGINNNIKNKKIDKLLDKKNLEQLLLNKEKLKQ